MSYFPRDFGMYLGEISAVDVGKRSDCKQVSKSVSLVNVKKYLPNTKPNERVDFNRDLVAIVKN